jgi:hypothetical protein
MPINKKIGFQNLILFLLFLILVMSFCSCGGGGSGSSNTSPTTPTTPTTQNWEEEEVCAPAEVTLPRFMDYSDDGLTIREGGHRLVIGLDSADDFYDFSTIKRIDLTFSQGNWWTLLTNNYQSETEIPATMSYYNAQNIQKTLAAHVGVRFKGDTSYQQNNTQKII